MHSNILRSKFIHFFKNREHVHVPSSPVVPKNDPTILFTNAGMNQFKEVFLGHEISEYKRAVTIQKCIRAGGKHNDLSQVGFTARHLTFFEMMGNFSFGDYFKKEAIRYAWDFIVKELQIPEEKCWVTVYKDDQMAFDIWHKDIGLPAERIGKLGEKDNFWQMGDTGPCGPCSEIYIDRGITCDIDKNARPGDGDSTRFVEIWNNVFMEFSRINKDTFEPLQKTGIDTGMGLERLAMILQDVPTVFDTDIFNEMLKVAEKRFKTTRNSSPFNSSALCVLADHMRSSGMIISENVLPSNEGRGYVVRKIVRRALLFAHKLGDIHGFIDLVDPFIESLQLSYPELKNSSSLIKDSLQEETNKFFTSLEQGEKKFFVFAEEGKISKIIKGEHAFMLYDTYGFPLELTEVLAAEKGLKIDEPAFNLCMEEQRERSRSHQAFKKNDIHFSGAYSTNFIGYDALSCNSLVQAINVDGKEVDELRVGVQGVIIVDQTCFYAQGGGQVSDKGYLFIGNEKIEVEKVIKDGDARGFLITPPCTILCGAQVHQEVDKEHRTYSSCNHTAAHLLQAALRKYFGNSVHQAGSYVDADYMRFDATFSEPFVMSDIRNIESYINDILSENILVETFYTTYQQAIDNKVMAVFAEKYNKENVRVVKVGNFSQELCGGTHVARTGDIGSFKIVETSVPASGIRRFVALTGKGACERYAQWYEIISFCGNAFKCPSNGIIGALEKNILNVKKKQQECDDLQNEYISLLVKQWKTQTVLLQNIPCGFFVLSLASLVLHVREIVKQFQAATPGIYSIVSASGSEDKQSLYIAVHASYKASIDFSRFEDELKKVGFKGKIINGVVQGIVSTTFLLNELKKIVEESLIKA